MKLWEPPYYDTEKKAPVEGNLNELAVTLMVIINFITAMDMSCLLSSNPSWGGPWSSKTPHLPRPADAAAERPGKVGRKRQVGSIGLKSKAWIFSLRFKESGVASFKLRCAKGLKCKVHHLLILFHHRNLAGEKGRYRAFKVGIRLAGTGMESYGAPLGDSWLTGCQFRVNTSRTVEDYNWWSGGQARWVTCWSRD